MAEAVILTVTLGGQVIVPPDYYGVKWHISNSVWSIHIFFWGSKWRLVG